MYNNSELMEATALQSIFQTFWDIQMARYVATSALALILYDTLQSLPEELDFIWMKRLRLGAFLYLLSRYATIAVLSLVLAFNLLEGHVISQWLCYRMTQATSAIQVVQAIGIQGILFARAYAISRRAPGVAAMLAIPLGISLLATIALIAGEPCTAARPSWPRNLVQVSDVCKILFEAGIVGVTVYHTWGIYRTRKVLATSHKGDITYLLLKQGVARFALIFIWELEISITQKLVRNFLIGIDGPLENAISTILVCRFHLNLQRRMVHSEGNTLPAPSLTSFHATFPIKSLGQHIRQEFGDPEDGWTDEDTSNGVVGAGPAQKSWDLKLDILKPLPPLPQTTTRVPWL